VNNLTIEETIIPEMWKSQILTLWDLRTFCWHCNHLILQLQQIIIYYINYDLLLCPHLIKSCLWPNTSKQEFSFISELLLHNCNQFSSCKQQHIKSKQEWSQEKGGSLVVHTLEESTSMKITCPTSLI